MTSYVVKRLFQGILAFFGVSILVFVMGRMTGDPVALMVPDNASQEAKDAVRISLGLDKPIPEQYVDFLGDVLTGDFGTSYVSNRSVTEAVQGAMPGTLKLAFLAFLIAVVLAIPIGIFVACKRNTIWDLLGNILALVGQAMPNFWLALMLMLIFGVKLKILPISGSDGAASIILPSVALALQSLGYFVRMVRSSMLDVLNQEYIRTARGKGLRNQVVIWKHALKNAMVPVLTVMGMQFGNLLSGAFVIETVFAWPGLGRLGVNALLQRDFAMIQGVILVSTMIFVVVNLLVDILYTVFVPSVRVK